MIWDTDLSVKTIHRFTEDKVLDNVSSKKCINIKLDAILPNAMRAMGNNV